jgi:hypothetical protein
MVCSTHLFHHRGGTFFIPRVILNIDLVPEMRSEDWKLACALKLVAESEACGDFRKTGWKFSIESKRMKKKERGNGTRQILPSMESGRRRGEHDETG